MILLPEKAVNLREFQNTVKIQYHYTEAEKEFSHELFLAKRLLLRKRIFLPKIFPVQFVNFATRVRINNENFLNYLQGDDLSATKATFTSSNNPK